MSGSALQFLSLRCVSNEKYTSGRPFAFFENITEHQEETPTKNDANWANATCLGAVISCHFHFLPVTRDCGKAGWHKLCYYAPKKSVGCWVPAWLPVWFLAIFSPKSFKTVDIRWCFLRFFFIPGFPASRFKTTAGRTVVFWNWFRVWTLAENVSSSAWPYLMCSVNIPNLPLARLFCKRRCQACKINIPWCCSAGFVVPILSWRYGSLQKSARILFVGIPCLFFQIRFVNPCGFHFQVFKQLYICFPL